MASQTSHNERPILKSAKFLSSVCITVIVVTTPLWAGDPNNRFIEISNETSTETYDLNTVQMISPGKFTIISTTINHLDVMKFRLGVYFTLKDYCERPAGEYDPPAELFTLGDTDMPIKKIEVRPHLETWSLVKWSLPYKRFAAQFPDIVVPYEELLYCGKSDGERSRHFLEAINKIMNGSRSKKLFDCKRGILGYFDSEKDDPQNARMLSFVRPGTIAFDHHAIVCFCVLIGEEKSDLRLCPARQWNYR